MSDEAAIGEGSTQEVPAISKTDTDAAWSQSGARLIELVGSRTGRVYRVEGEEVILGRDEGAQVAVQGNDISRRHARIFRRNGEWHIEDLGSTNGLCINGRPMAQGRLSFGDHLQLGGSTLFVFTYYDQLEEQIMQVQRMESMGSLAGGVAHDFNNLLSVLLGNIDFLEQRRQVGDVDGATLGECLSEMRDAAGHAEELIRQLLRFSRPSRGGNATLDCTRLVLDAVGLCRRTFGPTISFEVDADPALAVHGDGGQLNQVLMNLLINARDAMPKGGSLAVRAKPHLIENNVASPVPYLSAGEYIRIDVEDSGVGMDEQTRNRVFEPFFTTKDDDQGTGLGLSTVYALVRKHGGHVMVSSQLEVGSVFTVYLPAAPARTTLPTAPLDSSLAAEGLLLDNPKVLLVDDDSAVLRTTSRLLRQIGYDVFVANSGNQALEIYRDKRSEIELVILDVLMPDLDGGRTLKLLLQQDPSVRVLLISGRADEGAIEALLEAGAQGFVAKPCGANSLRQAIDAALN